MMTIEQANALERVLDMTRARLRNPGLITKARHDEAWEEYEKIMKIRPISGAAQKFDAEVTRVFRMDMPGVVGADARDPRTALLEDTKDMWRDGGKKAGEKRQADARDDDIDHPRTALAQRVADLYLTAGRTT